MMVDTGKVNTMIILIVLVKVASLVSNNGITKDNPASSTSPSIFKEASFISYYFVGKGTAIEIQSPSP